jgi:hypothetical protein
VITGGVFWLTFTLNEQFDCRSALSSAVHVTTLVPSANDDPLGGEHELLCRPDASLALKEKVTGTEGCPLGLMLIAAGQLIVGEVVS